MHSNPERLGLFGGSFDPVHAGHMTVARAAQAAFALDQVCFVPAARPPHKPGRRLAGGRHRLAMLALATVAEPSWEVSDVELGREGPSYTIDTVRALRARPGWGEHAQLWMILGSDNLEGLGQWHRVRELLQLVHPVVVLREGDPGSLPESLARVLDDDQVESLERGFLRLPPAAGRSTDLRRALAAGASEHPDLPPGVGEYIRTHGLYRAVR